ncbi:hypothetical protein T06_14865 [Trichinella sp. T6]|nr:hypothetical protein T06_14865 [Trichinella sp. T6]
MDGSGVAAKRTDEFAERLLACLPACLLGYLSALQSIDHLSSICTYILQRFLHFACMCTGQTVTATNRAKEWIYKMERHRLLRLIQHCFIVI